MLVSGPIGAIATGSLMIAQDPRDELDTAFGHGGRRRLRQHGGADPTLTVDLGRADDPADERTRRTLADGMSSRAIRVQQTERVLGAMTDVGVATDRGDRQARISGLARASPMASASSSPGSLSMISGIG